MEQPRPPVNAYLSVSAEPLAKEPKISENRWDTLFVQVQIRLGFLETLMSGADPDSKSCTMFFCPSHERF
jgi:hypothetical protein